MKNYLILLLSFAYAAQLSANTLYEQLCHFNFNWKKYEAIAPNGMAIDFNSDSEYIEAHLRNVIPILKQNPVDHLSDEQLRARLFLINTLEGYCNSGNFPINYHFAERTPVFIDEHGTHCAVGYLLQQSGYDHVAQRIAANENFAWVKDISDEAIPSLQQASGLSLEEVKLIQGAYDFYMPGAFFAPNKYEIPQKPHCVTAYFDDNKKHVWCKGEGKDGILNGRWEQNYSEKHPWIVGFYSNGKRTGQWKEYYQGTDKLCRTENWRNDKLNGVRTRFNMEGEIIEEILFKDGKAVLKTNYDFRSELKYIRTPLDSNLVKTEVYDFGGALIASGDERIYNPGNLEWFQDIQLTALNSAAVFSREVTTSNQVGFNDGGFGNYSGVYGMKDSYNSPALVEYHKVGEWIFLQEFNPELIHEQTDPESYTADQMLSNYFEYFSQSVKTNDIFSSKLKFNSAFDSIKVSFKDNNPLELLGFGSEDYIHLAMDYHETLTTLPYDLFYPVEYSQRSYSPFRPINYKPVARIKSIGQFNREKEKIGTWRYFNTHGKLYKTESFHIPWREEEHNLVSNEAGL